MYLSGKSRERPAQQSGLSGRLECVSLIDLAQLLVEQTGSMRIRHRDYVGTVTFGNGAVLAASYKGLTGRDAYLEMALLAGGSFRFDESEDSPEREIHLRADSLQFDAAMYLDHWAALWEKGITADTRLGWLGYTPEEKEQITADPVRIALWNRLEKSADVGSAVWELADLGFDRIDLLKALEALWEASVLQVIEDSEEHETQSDESAQWLVRMAERVRRHLMPRAV